MGLTLDAKRAIVEEVNSIAAVAPSAIAAEYIGLTVTEMTELRNAAREAGVYLKVVRNTLARRALENTQFECMRDNLVGPLLLVFSNDEPGSAAKVVRNFAKSNKKLEIKLVSLDGNLLEPSEITKLASLPSLDEAHVMLLGLLSSPLTKFVCTISEPPSKFARVLGSKCDKQ
ncbi:MAG: 50S ribosomal protein L10 [Pseudomonadota bacterium]|nr:50S ribosomal protein L10 [Pseudomonadota bacterium]